MSSPRSASDRVFLPDADQEVARRRYRELAEAIDEGVYRLDSEWHVVAVNDAFLAATGYSREDLLGEHVSLLLSRDDLDRLKREVRRQREARDPTPLTLSLRTVDGETTSCVVDVTASLTDGDFRGSIGVVRRDDESGPSADDWTRPPEDVLRTIVAETGDAVVVLDDAFEVVWADATFGRYFDVDPDRLVGRDKREVIPHLKGRFADPDRFARRVLATYEDNTYVETFTCHVTPAEGREERWLEHWSKPIRSGQYAGGRIECYADVTDRIQSAEAREEAEREFTSLVDAVTEYAIFRLDPDGTVTSWNDGARAIKGYERGEIVGEHFSTFYTDEDRAAGRPERNLELALEQGSVEDEGWRVRRDGTRFWANVTITAVRDEDGSHRSFLKVTRDLTDRHEYQQELENELHTILDRISAGFCGLDDAFRFTYLNDRAADLIDVDPEEAKGRSLWKVFPEAIGTTFEEQYRRAMREQVSVSFEEFFEPLGIWFSVSAYPSETGLSVYFRDVTERRQRQKALREREQELEEHKEFTDDVLNAIDDLFYVVDREGNFKRWNESLRTVTGYSDDEIEAMHPQELIVEEDRERLLENIRTIFDTGSARLEATVLTKSGEEVPMEFVASAVEAPGGEQVLAGIGRDVTQRKRRQRQLEESNERLEQFAYAASHDLQEPLRMVSSYLQLVEDRYADALDADGREFIAYAVDGADRMRDMIDGLLAYSRIESRGDSFEPVALEAVLGDVLNNLSVKCEEADAEITVEPLPRVEGDAGQLRQLFQNLLDNAIAYSGDAPPEIHVSAEREGGRWLVSVRDDGVGIDPADTDRIFEVFQSLDSDEQASGIGLALCKRIVDRHGGDIWVDSSPGEGATFSFTLPDAGEKDA